MEDFPFVTHASWTLSYDCDTVKKIIFFCSLRVLVYKECFSVQPSMRSELMFISFFSFSQNEWLEFHLCCSFILINDSLQPAHKSVLNDWDEVCDCMCSDWPSQERAVTGSHQPWPLTPSGVTNHAQARSESWGNTDMALWLSALSWLIHVLLYPAALLQAI